MGRLNRSRSGRVGRWQGQRYCPRCLGNTVARPSAVRGPYELLMSALLGLRRLECGDCGMRLSKFESLDLGSFERRRVDRDESFMKPSDGRPPSRLLEDLKQAEAARDVAGAVRPLRRRRAPSAPEG